MKLIIVFAFVFIILSSSSVFAQTACFSISASVVTGGPFPPSAVPDCSQYPSGTVLINTSNSGDPNYAAWQTYAADGCAGASCPNSTANKQAAAQMAVNAAAMAGIALTCSTYTTLTGTFATTQANLDKLANHTRQFATNGQTYPTATQVPSLLDTSNVRHLIPSAAALKALDAILTGYSISLNTYLNNVIHGDTPTMPAATSSAC